MSYSNALFQKRFPQLFGYNDLDCENQELYAT